MNCIHWPFLFCTLILSRSTFLNRFNDRIEKVSIYRPNGDVQRRKIQRKIEIETSKTTKK